MWRLIWRTAIIIVALAAVSYGQASEYEWPIVKITNTTDFQWSRIDTVKAVYIEAEHTTTLQMNGSAKKWLPPYVVQMLNSGEAVTDADDDN